MPIYEYECKICGYKAEVLKVNTKEKNDVKCPNCLIPLTKIISPSTFILKGKGWSKDGYKT